MVSRRLKATYFFVSLALVLILFYFIIGFSFKEIEKEKSCVDVNRAIGFSFNTCFDVSSKKIYLDIKRGGYEFYKIKEMKVSFIDSSEKNFDLIDLPSLGKNKTFSFYADFNPLSLNLVLDIEKDFPEEICKQPKKLLVKDCVRASQLGEEEKPPKLEVDEESLYVENFIKEDFWRSQCASEWECSSWGLCELGIQRRSCKDLKNCFVPVDMPLTAKYCGDFCIEGWDCNWSDCSNGFIIPVCTDLNSCGTEYNKPRKVPCEDFDSAVCNPIIKCEEWSKCSIEYDFLEVSLGGLENVSGTKSRICSDINSCVGSVRETIECSTSIDIYTKRFEKCNTEYVEIYNQLDNKLIARIEDRPELISPMNIRLDEGFDNIYCDYCSNGLMDEDEKGVDCGGSCEACKDKYGSIKYKKRNLWEKIWNLF